ncbi:DNA adenine methylase [Aquimarina sp. 2201CG1-2-11]|uniref:DNA adenine methylase n=1 Tax=Aquimarina discodermiae TaxID=3231043 RepID=UPI003462F87D
MESPLHGLGKISKTPISYYGGKQNLTKLILSLLPKHKLYCEPFVGGAAIFFAKEPSAVEVINDLNGDVVNFYRVCKLQFHKLQKLVQATPHSRKLHVEAAEILKSNTQKDAVKRAWAFWVQTNMSFSSRVFGGYAYERQSNGVSKTILNKKNRFITEICERLDLVDIECNDALKVIESRDTKDTFFYIDPPYFNSDMGHYKGYTLQDFEKLLQLLSTIKGKFLLSSYPSDILEKYTKKNKWHQQSIEKTITVTKGTRNKKKIEMLTANYTITKPMEMLSGISTEKDFIARFLKMHKTVQSRDALRNYIFDLQKAITHKEITKESLYAQHIEQIQQKLIVQHNNLILKEKVKIVINRKWRLTLQRIITDNEMEGLGNISRLEDKSSIHIPLQPSETDRLFTPINSPMPLSTKNTFKLDGALGELLGDLEKFELAITIEGDQGGGKTRFTYQLADAFATIKNRIAIFSLEIGSRSDLITRMKGEYLQPKNQDHIFITDQLPEGYTTISNTAKDFDVIIIDSWNKTGLPSQDFDRLRKQHPDTIFIVIFQRTTQKTIRGGTALLFDAGINIEVVKVDDTFQNNYAVTTKNRYRVTGFRYNIHNLEVVDP